MLPLIWFPFKSKFLNVLAPPYHDRERLSLITRCQDYYKFNNCFQIVPIFEQRSLLHEKVSAVIEMTCFSEFPHDLLCICLWEAKANNFFKEDM